MDQQVIALGNRRPESRIEHPVGVGGEREAIARIIVAADGVLVDVGGLDDVAGGGLEAVASKSAGVLVAGIDFGFEAAVPAFFLSGFEGLAVFGEFNHLGGVGHGQEKAGADFGLFGRGEVGRDEQASGGEAKIWVEQAIVKIGIQMAEAGGELGSRRIAMFVKPLPDGIAVAAERVEGHADFRAVSSSFHDEIPVSPEAGDEVGVIRNPTVAEDSHFEEVHDAEDHQRLVRGDAEAWCFRRVEVGEFTEPVG